MKGRRRQKRDPTALNLLPWQQVKRAFKPIEILSEDQVEAVHRTSLDILHETGVHFMGAAAREFLARHSGVSVDKESQIVRFDPDMIEETIRSVPGSFRVHARNPAHDLNIGGDFFCFTNVVTPPYLTDLDRGKRTGTEAEFRDQLRLCQSLNIVHLTYGYPVEPQDLDVETRHLDAYRAQIELTDKIWRGYTLGKDRINDAIEMARIARGISRETMRTEPSFIANVTTNSPLRIDEPMGDGIMIMAETNQPVSISAFTMAGAIAPITLAGALVQQNAEILAGIALGQLVRAGAPVVYGAFTTNVHMRSGAIAFGNPEFMKATIASGQLARRYGVPFKAAVTTGSKVVDAQAAYETQASLWAAVAGGGNIISHACGFVESGMSVSREKMIVDAEMMQMMTELMKPVGTDTESLATSAIGEVGPGGHFFDSPHTLARYETAFYEPLVSDWENLETWQEKGAKTADVRANEIWKQLLAEYEQPPLDPAIKEELEAYVAKRRTEITRALQSTV